MAKLHILKEGDETLRKISRPIDTITPRIQTLIDDMVETMRAADGCGLAAPQVGVLRRVVVIECEPDKLYVLINPKVTAYAGHQEEAEGCLSIPGKWGITNRPKSVTVEALDRNGKKITVTGSDLLARALCHEIDHLDGKLFTDCTIRMLEPDKD